MKRWPLNTTYFWESAPFFRILIPFAIGILLYDQMGTMLFTQPVFLLIGLISLLLLYTGSLFLSRQHRRFLIISFCLLHFIFLLSGFTLSYYSDIRNNRNWFGSNLNNVSLARITDNPAEKENSWKVAITIINTINDGKIQPACGKAFLYLYKDMPMLFHKGDSILLPANWQSIKNAGNPHEFDYSSYCRRNNIFYLQSCSLKQIRLFAAADPTHAPLLEKSHDWCMLQLDKFVIDRRTKGLLQAMLLGDEINLDEDLLHAYSETGIVHIIAISGGNVVIFFMAISWLLWWLKHKKYSWVKYLVAFPLVWFYVLMAGAQPSAIRAAIMFSLLAAGVILQKNNNGLNQLLATAFLLLCGQPFWLFSVGFQLSFVAVLSLVLFYKPIYKYLSPANIVARKLWETISASIAAKILVAPLVVYYFHIFPLLFIVSNVLAYLFMGIVLILSIVIISLFWFPALATFTGFLTAHLVNAFDYLISVLQKCNPISFHFLTLNNAELVLVYMIITSIILFLIKHKKAMLYTSLITACLLVGLFGKDQWVRLTQQKLIVYNINKTNRVEVIKGRTFASLNSDSMRNKKIDYEVMPAHTALQAWNEDRYGRKEILSFHGKTVLILNADITTSAEKKFPVDYLIINYTDSFDAAKLQRIFSPSQMIIGNNFSPSQMEVAKQACRDNHIAAHFIQDNGAFIR